MEIRIEADTQIEEISVKEFNVAEVNRIKKVKGGALRQDSKGPTFRSYLSRNLDHSGEQPGILGRES